MSAPFQNNPQAGSTAGGVARGKKRRFNLIGPGLQGLWVPVALLLLSTLDLESKTKLEQHHPGLDAYLRQSGFFRLQLHKKTRGNSLVGDGIFCGKKRSFLVDSGCSITRVDKSLASKMKTVAALNVTLADELLGDIEGDEVILLDRVEISGAAFFNQPALPIRMGVIGATAEYEVVLGSDFLLRNNCMIDVLDGRLYVRSKPPTSEGQQAIDETLRAAGYQEVKLAFGISLVPRCRVIANGLALPMVVDTGAESTSIDDDIAKQLHLKLASTGILETGFEDVGANVTYAGKLESFQVGDVVFDNMGVAVTKLEKWHIAEKSSTNNIFQGLLGKDFMDKDQALIDYNGRHLWFIPFKPDKQAKK